MGLSPTVWFVSAAIALLAGAAMLVFERRGAGGADVRERKRWASMRGWDYLAVDPVLPSRWRYGTIHRAVRAWPAT